MPNVYVRSGAAGTGTGADWTNAFTTLSAAFTAKAAGDTFWVSEDHAETQATAMGNTSPGTLASPCFVICVDHAGTVPPVSADLRTTATITTTTTGVITNDGSAYFYGIIFTSGNGANSVNMVLTSTANWQRYDSCALHLGGTAGGNIQIPGTANQSSTVEWVNTTYQVAAIGSTIQLRSVNFRWRNTASAITGATIPTTLFGEANAGGTVLLEGVDLSAIPSGKTIFPAGAVAHNWILKDCRLAASVTVAATPTGPQHRVTMIRSDSAGTNYRTEVYDYLATQTVETTIIRTGGASDGTTPISWKIVSTANSKWVLPFECIPTTVECETTGSHTVTVYGTTTGGGVPNNDDIWITAEYLKDSGDPLGGFVTTTKSDNLAASTTTNNSSDASTWGGGGAGNGFKMVTPSFTVNQKGPITVYVYVAKATTTYYVDPRPSISGITVNRSMILAPGVYANELGGGSGSFSYIS